MTSEPLAPYMLSRAEAARYCGVSLSTLKLWMAGGIVRPVQMPFVNRVLFRRRDLEAFCQAQPERGEQ